MIETLDVRTLLLILFLGHAIAALLLFFATLKRAQIYDTVFMISMALQAAGWLLLFFRGAIPDILSFSLGNTLIFCGFCLEGLALLSLVRPVDIRWQRLFAAVLALSLIIIWLPLSGQDLNVGIVSFVIPIFFVFPGIFLVFSGSRPSPLQQFTGSILLLYIVAVVARGAYLLLARSYNLLEPTFFQVLFLSVQIGIMVLASTGYILIRREFAVEDLEQDITRRRQVEEEFLVQSELLEERVKELRCLYTVAGLIESDPEPVSLLAAVARSLPEGYRYPATTGVRIITGDQEYRSDNYREGTQMQRVPLKVHGEITGTIEIVFFGEEHDGSGTAFLPEETELLSAVAERISRVLERISVEKSRHDSEEKYRKLFEQVNDAIFIADVGTRQITDCNRKAEDLTGYTRTEILAMKADALHPPDLQVQTMDRFRAFLEGKTSSIETEVISRYGKRIPVSINATPVEFGGRSRLIGIFRDITWQKEVQKAIQERTEEVDQFFSTSLDLFCIADTDGYFRRLNPEWETTLGWSVAELEGKKILDYVHPDDIPATLEAMRDLSSQNVVIGFVNRYRHRDGTYRWIEWRSAPRGTRVFAAARDITQHYLDERYNAGLSHLKQELLISGPLKEKLRKITDTCVSLFGADFARIWMTRPGDLCEQGCIYAGVAEGPDACKDHTSCLHLVVSSGRYTHTDGGHGRVPFGAYKIGRIASGDDPHLITNDVVHDPRVHDHAWAASLGLVAFAGFRLLSSGGKPVGVLALFSRQQITPDIIRYLDDLATTASQVIQTAAAEEALRESEERFRRLLSRSFDAIVVHQAGRIVLVNDAALRIIGAQESGDIVGKPVIGLVHPDYRDAVVGRVQEMLAAKDGTVPLMEEKFLRIDGTPITVAVMATTTQHQGKPAVLVVFRDITEQKEAEDALFQSRQMLQLVIDTIPQRVFWKDKDSVYLGCNLPLAQDAGYASPEDLIGKDDFATAYKETADLYRSDDQQIMGSGIPRLHYEEPQVKRDGTRAWLSTSKIPLRDRNGEIIGILGTYEDITRRKKMEQALRESEVKFRAIFNSTFQFTGLMQPDGTLLEANEAALAFAGIPRDEVVNRPFWETPWWRGDEQRVQLLQEAIRTAAAGQFVRYEVELSGSGSVSIPVDFSLKPVQDTKGNVRLLIPEARDISSRKAAEMALIAEKQFTDTIIDSIPGIFYVFDEGGRFIRRNRNHKTVTGYSDEELQQITALDTIAPEDRDLVTEKLREALIHGVTTVTVNVLTKDKKKIPYLLGGLWMTVAGKQYLVGTGIDITEQVRAQEALRESEDRFSRAIAGTGAGLWDWDMVNDRVFFSPQWKSMLGYDDSEIADDFTGWKDLWHPDDAARIEKSVTDYLEGRTTVYEIEHRLRHKDGSWHWILTRGDIHRDAAGKPVRWVGTNIDVTARKLTEEAVAAAVRLNALIDTLSVGECMSYSLDEAERLTSSQIGFFHFVNEGEKTIQLVAWSSETKKFCFIPKEPERNYPVDAAGVWVDCLRERRTVIHNDYAGIPGKKGLPEGHVPVIRELVIPIFDSDRIVAIIGVGNKATDYDAHDADIVTLIAKNTWTLIQRKRAEDALRESEERYHNLIDTSHDIIYSLSKDGVFLFVSPAWTEILGHPVADVVGRNFAEFVHPDDLPACYDFLRNVLESGERQEGVEYRVRHVDGSWRWHSSSATPLQKAAGEIDRFTGIAHDITRRRQAEDALRESEEKFRGIIENIQDFVYRADMAGNFIMVNPSGIHMLGYDSMDQMAGRPVTDVYANPDERKLFLEALRQTGSVQGYPLTLKARNGTHIHVIASSHYFYDAAGSIMGVEGVLHDLTDLHRAEEGLRVANRKLNLLSSITRHDIMNQLLALNGYIQLSAESLEEPDTLRSYLLKEEKIAQTIERQIRFTKDYEDLGVRVPAWQDVALVVKNVSTTLPMQDIRLEILCPALEIYADPLLEKVFYNLIDNSLHYGGEKMTVIRVTVEQKNDTLRIIYEDNGEGITEEDKTRLFTKGFGKHTGLGLFLSREILAITGITIIEDGEPGRGVRFVMTVPKGGYRMSGVP